MARTGLKNVCRLIDSVKEVLPPEKDFLNDLKRSIEITDEKGRRKASQTYKPSSMTCIRNMYYQRIGQDADEGNSSYISVGICGSGSDTHLRIQRAVTEMKDNGIDCEYINVADFIRNRGLDDIEIVKESDFENGEYETKLFHKKLTMSFLCDGIIRYKGHYYILELKTESSYKWSTRQGVDEKHFAQGTAYSIAFNIPEVLFVYINRDLLDMKAFMFTPTDDMKQNLIGTIDNCEGYVNQKKVPPIPDNIPKRICEYCGYKETCRKELN